MPITNGMGQRAMNVEQIIKGGSFVITHGGGIMEEDIRWRTDMSGGCGKEYARKNFPTSGLFAEYLPTTKKVIYLEVKSWN